MDMSKYDMFLLCNYRFRNRYKLNLDKTGTNANLDRGNLIHIANECYYESLKSGAKYDYAVNAALMKLKSAFVAESELDEKEARLIFDTMEEYYDFWRMEDEQLEILEVEKPFLFLLHEDDEVRIHLSGKIDLIYNDRKEGLRVMDHKSHKRSGPVNTLANQFKCYTYATNTHIMYVNKIGLQTSLKAHEKFLRTPVSYDPLVHESWKRNVVANIMRYLECEATDVWPTNETSCDKYNRQCEYKEVCERSGDEAKDLHLMNFYKRVPAWDVTQSMKKSSELLQEKIDSKQTDSVEG